MNGRRTTDNRWDPDDVPWLLAGLITIGAVLLVFGVLLDYSALDVWSGIVVFLVLMLLSLPLFRRVARAEGDPWLYRVLVLALAVKFVASMARFFMIQVIYDGSSDAGKYHEAGVTFVNRLRDGAPIHPIPIMENFPVETQRIGDVVGGIYTVTGPSQYAGFLVFAFLCFWGQVFMFRGFSAAVPEGDHRRFALLALFVPSVVFWPSSIGKEALLIFCIGLTVYGGGLLLAPRPRLRGALFFIAGTLLVLLVRPHVAIMSIGGLVLALAVGLLTGFRGSSASEREGVIRGAGRGRAVRLVGLCVLILLAVGASGRMGEVFGDDEGELSAQAALEDAQQQSSIGGSEFDPVAVAGVRELPAAIISVYFRPFPWEATNFNALLAAGETLILLGALALNWRRVLNFPRMALRRPFLVFCSSYVLLFAVGFSYIANFGILTRQRVQALPILLMILAIPAIPRHRFVRSSESGDDEGAEETVVPVDSVVDVQDRAPLGERVVR